MTPTQTLAATATRSPNKREINAKLARKTSLLIILMRNIKNIWYAKKIFHAGAKLSCRGHPGSGKKVGNSREKWF